MFEKKLIYTGGVQTVTLSPGKYILECWGGKYISSGKIIMFGGYAKGVLDLKEQKTLYVYVGSNGGAPSDRAIGGGGLSGTGDTPAAGATDIRTVEGNLNTRFLVAGGCSSWPSNVDRTLDIGGHGGGEEGVAGIDTIWGTLKPKGGNGGTQKDGGLNRASTSTTYKGAFGQGGKGYGNTSWGPSYGGGGGWYGGGGGHIVADSSMPYGAPGGGGSSYALTETSYKPSGYAVGAEFYLTETLLASIYDEGYVHDPTGVYSKGGCCIIREYVSGPEITLTSENSNELVYKVTSKTGIREVKIYENELLVKTITSGFDRIPYSLINLKAGLNEIRIEAKDTNNLTNVNTKIIQKDFVPNNTTNSTLDSVTEDMADVINYIKTLTIEGKRNLKGCGVDISNIFSLEQCIQSIKELGDSSDKGVATGEVATIATAGKAQYFGNTSAVTLTNWVEIRDLGFKPNILVAVYEATSHFETIIYIGFLNMVIVNKVSKTSSTSYAQYCFKSGAEAVMVNQNVVMLPSYATVGTYKWVAL